MDLITELYTNQSEKWPRRGRQILAQFDDEAIVVYQAYRPAIGHFAAKNGYFGGPFRFNRISWIKPSFLWMMHRSEWGTAKGQEVILAVWLKMEAFLRILRNGVLTHYEPAVFKTEKEWKKAMHATPVRVQWDPDYLPNDQRAGRRAIQIGLQKGFLVEYAKDMVLHIEDISAFVAEQRSVLRAREIQKLHVPKQDIFPIREPAIESRIGAWQAQEKKITLPQ